MRRPLLLLVMATCVQTLGAVVAHSLGILAPFIIYDLEIGEAQFGALTSAMHIGSLGALLVGASVIDRFGPVRLLGAGAAISGCVLLVGVLAADYLALLAVLVVVGATWGLSAIAGGDVIILDAPVRRRAMLTSLRQLALPIGGLIAAAFAPLVVSLDWDGILSVEAAVLSVSGIGILASRLVYPHRSRRSPWIQRPTRRAALIGTMAIGLTITQTAFLVYAVLELTERVALPFEAAAMLYLGSQAAGACSRVVLGAASDRLMLGRHTLLALTTALAGVCGIAFGFLTPSAPMWMVAAVVLGGSTCLIGWNGVLVVALLEAGSSADVNRNLSAGMTLMRVGIIVTPPVFGLALTTIGSTAAWLGIGVMMLGIATGFAVIGRSAYEKQATTVQIGPTSAP